MGENAELSVLSGAASAGALGGLGLGALLTLHMDARDDQEGPTTSFTITPDLEGHGVIGSVSGRF